MTNIVYSFYCGETKVHRRRASIIKSTTNLYSLLYRAFLQWLTNTLLSIILCENKRTCRSLKKSHERKNFTRFLRSTGYDVLVLQETHASDEFTMLNLLLQATSSSWTYDCGIVLLNTNYTINTINTGLQRSLIYAQIMHNPNNSTQDQSAQPIAHIINIYGEPATQASKKTECYNKLIHTDFLDPIISDPNAPTFVMGDLNYSYDKHAEATGKIPGIPIEWTDLLEDIYTDCFKDDKQITFRRRNDASIIDHLFCNDSCVPFVSNQKQLYISANWTDHAMLSINFQFTARASRGPGAWKANPFLAKKKEFRSALAVHLTQQQTEVLELLTFMDHPQEWDWIKVDTKRFIRKFQWDIIHKRRNELAKLQSTRNMVLRRYKKFGILNGMLPAIEDQIGILQEDKAEIEIWRLAYIGKSRGRDPPWIS